MGLDMYLTKYIYIGADFDHNEVKGVIYLSNKDGPINVELDKVTSINEASGYWRSTRNIHNWMIENIQDNIDDCNEYLISFEQLQELKVICETTLKNKNDDLLPTLSGYLFDSTDFEDQFYENSLIYTIDLINNLDSNGEYYYQSSW